MYHISLFIYIGMQDRHVYNLGELVDALGANGVDYYAYRVCYGLAVMPYFTLRGNRLLKRSLSRYMRYINQLVFSIIYVVFSTLV